MAPIGPVNRGYGIEPVKRTTGKKVEPPGPFVPQKPPEYELWRHPKPSGKDTHIVVEITRPGSFTPIGLTPFDERHRLNQNDENNFARIAELAKEGKRVIRARHDGKHVTVAYRPLTPGESANIAAILRAARG